MPLPDYLDEELDALAQQIRDAGPPGMQFEPYIASSDEIYLATIWLPPSARGSGAGTRAMRTLMQWADERGIPIALVPSADRGKKRALESFYRDLGFVPTRDARNYHPESAGTMRREPVKRTRKNPTERSNTMRNRITVGALLVRLERLPEDATIEFLVDSERGAPKELEYSGVTIEHPPGSGRIRGGRRTEVTLWLR